MKFQENINEGFIKAIPSDIIKAKSLIKSGEQAIYSAKRIPFEQGTLKSIIRELYEGLRQHCEAIGYINGYKFSTHEAITSFIDEILMNTKISAKFDRYRKIRNGINYYGDEVSEATVKNALKEIPEMVSELKKKI